MSEFNISSWFKNQYLTEAGLGSTKSQQLANSINSAMIEIDNSMSYKDFAEAVASILINEYGTHNFNPFMEVLHARLGMNESINENMDDDLAKEIDSRFGGNPYVRNGKIQFRMKNEFPDDKWDEILDLVKSKGFEIIDDSNYYDMEPKEREWFPTIKFKLK